MNSRAEREHNSVAKYTGLQGKFIR